MDVDTLFMVAERCVNLQSLDVAGLACVSDDLLVSVAKHCPRLEHIGLKGCVNVRF